MRAFAFDAFAEPGSIHELPDPQPAEGQVRVRVRAASINPFDSFVVQGYMKDRMKHPFPLVPCSDLSGTIDLLGLGVDGFAVGDPVFGITGRMVGEGTLAELTTAAAVNIARRPVALDEREAAAMPLAGVSALMSVEAADPKPRGVIVIVGASGGIGGYAVQLAAQRGARVIGVTSSYHLEYVKSLGAAEVVDRTMGDVLETLKSRHRNGVDAIIDTASDAGAMARLSELVRKGGVVISMRGAAAVDELAKRGIRGVNIQTRVTNERLTQLARLRAEGKLKAPMIHTYALEDAGEAFRAVGHSGGKIVVTIDGGVQ
jgi:NADPH2:quinone reductase